MRSRAHGHDRDHRTPYGSRDCSRRAVPREYRRSHGRNRWLRCAARYHIEALNDNAAGSFGAYLNSAGLQAKRVRDAAAACQGADIVVTLTPSTRPILALADIAPGTFVAGVGADNPHKHELAPDLLCASRVVFDSLPQASTMGDLHHAIASGQMTAGAVYSELADLADTVVFIRPMPASARSGAHRAPFCTKRTTRHKSASLVRAVVDHQ